MTKGDAGPTPCEAFCAESAASPAAPRRTRDRSPVIGAPLELAELAATVAWLPAYAAWLGAGGAATFPDTGCATAGARDRHPGAA